jgi:7-cyano-7-deazaguanine synthase
MKAIVLFSGGLDSTVMLALALAAKRSCLALSFDYGQRHRIELEAAKSITRHFGVEHKILNIDHGAFANSSLVADMNMPLNRTLQQIDASPIPSTYVPARNTLFLAFAIGQAEILQAQEIYFGPNALDHKNYVDCRPEYVKAYQSLINIATVQACEGSAPQLITPLLYLTKRDIVKLGREIKAPIEMSWSCYNPSVESKPCGRCDACILRQDAISI